MRPSDHPGSKPRRDGPESLPDTRPFTLAAAFLQHCGFANVVCSNTDGRGRDHFGLPVPTKLRHWREDYYEYRGGVYEKLQIEDLRPKLNEFLVQKTYYSGEDNAAKPLRVTAALKRDVFDQLRDLCQAHVESMPAWLNGRTMPKPSDVIAFKNGLLDLQSWIRDPDVELIPPTADWFSVNVLERDYCRGATCARWTKFLNDCLDEDAELVSLMQEWFGYCLTGNNTLQKMLWLHGVSGAGKSTVTTILSRLVGARNVVQFDLWDFAKDFGLLKFVGKRVAIAADAHLGRSAQADQVIAKFKQITGGDATSIGRKFKDDLDNIVLLTRFVLSTNEFPTLTDASDALIRRAMFIPFNKSFVGVENPHLVEQMAVELPGITNWALEGLGRLLARGKFHETRPSEEVARQFRRLQSPVHAFVEDCCETGAKCEAKKDELYKLFITWAKENERNVMSKDRFATKLFRAVPDLTDGKLRNNDARERIYRGVGIRYELP